MFDRSKEMRNVNLKTMQDILFEGELDFAHQITQFSNEKGYVRSLTPVVGDGAQKDFFRYRITETWAGAKAQIGWLVTTKAITKQDEVLQLPFEANEVTYYDEALKSRKALGKTTVALKVKGDKTSYSVQTPVVNFNPPACGTGDPVDPICIDWYYIEWDVNTGQLIEENYLYTTCTDGCNTGGGGGGTGEDPDNVCFSACVAEANGVINDMQAAGGDEQYMIADIDNLRKYKNPKWQILRNDFGNFKLWSQETGIIELIDPSENKWQWVSLVHTGMSLTGQTPPAVAVSYSQGTGTPSFVPGTQNILYAGMEVDFSVTVAFVCSSCPVAQLVPPDTKSYKVGKIFSAKPNAGVE